MDITTIISNYRITLADTTLLIQEPHFSFVCVCRGIHLLHESQYIHLLMAISRNCCAYRNNFTQWFKMIRVKKKVEVQSVEITFIRRLFLKFASSGRRHTFIIQNRKNSTTGKRINRNK